MKILNSGKPEFLLALVAGFLGSAAALATGILRIVNTLPALRGEESFGNTVFALILIIPFVAILWFIRPYAKSRWFILLPAALLSLSLVGISLASATIVFLPSMVLLITITLWLMRKEPPLKPNRRWLLPSLVVTAVVVAAFGILFSQQDPRTWQVVNWTNDAPTTAVAVRTQYVVWNPVTQADPTMHSWPSGAHLAGGGSISDVISNAEAGESLGLLIVGIGFTMLSFIRLDASPT